MNTLATSLNFNSIAHTVAHTVFTAEDGITLKTNSRFVAEVFGRRHDDVLKAIRNLGCSDVFRARNFAETSYLDSQGKVRPMIEMTFDGFSLLVFGFTGPKAIAFQEAYIDEFNRMRTALTNKADQRMAMLEKYARLPIVPLTNETRARVYELLTERVPVADIARICRCAQATVRLLRDAQTTPASTGDLFGQTEGGAA
jgi:Rha family phage regulatory protein